jgi:hypothetical protein
LQLIIEGKARHLKSQDLDDLDEDLAQATTRRSKMSTSSTASN